MTEQQKCPWCEVMFTPLRPNGGGLAQVFCTPAHKNAFHSSLRRYALNEFKCGRVTMDELRRSYVPPRPMKTKLELEDLRKRPDNVLAILE